MEPEPLRSSWNGFSCRNSPWFFAGLLEGQYGQRQGNVMEPKFGFLVCFWTNFGGICSPVKCWLICLCPIGWISCLVSGKSGKMRWHPKNHIFFWCFFVELLLRMLLPPMLQYTVHKIADVAPNRTEGGHPCHFLDGPKATSYLSRVEFMTTKWAL